MKLEKIAHYALPSIIAASSSYLIYLIECDTAKLPTRGLYASTIVLIASFIHLLIYFFESGGPFARGFHRQS